MIWGKHDKVCLLTAHPDDEVLFFTPTIARLKADLEDPLKQLFLFCCTHGKRRLRPGESDRFEELKKCWTDALSLNEDNLAVLNRPELPDGLSHQWDMSYLVNSLSFYLAENKISWIITFDRRGVSGHLNHCSCWRASVEVMSANLPRLAHLQGALQLTTLPLYLKYLSVLGALIWWLLRFINSRPDEFLNICYSGYGDVFRGMNCHESQFVWHRYAFVIFSTYAIYNELSPVDFSSIHLK